MLSLGFRVLQHSNRRDALKRRVSSVPLDSCCGATYDADPNHQSIKS